MAVATKKKQKPKSLNKGEKTVGRKGLGISPDISADRTIPLSPAGQGMPWDKWPVEEIPLKDIHDDGHNHRAPTKAEKKELQDMAESIKLFGGVLQEIGVQRGVGGGYDRIFGSRRCEASLLAGRKTIRAKISPSRLSAAEVQDLRVIENNHRKELNPAEKALQARELVNAHAPGKGMEKAIEYAGQRLGIKPAAVKDLLYVMEGLAGRTRELLAAGWLHLGHARALVKCTDPARQAQIAEDIAYDAGLTPEGEEEEEDVARKTWSVQDVENVVANEMQSLEAVQWELDKSMPTKVAGCDVCDTCPSNSANNPGLFGIEKDGSTKKRICGNPAGYAAKQQLVQVAHGKVAAKVAALIKDKTVVKAEAGGAEVVRKAIAGANVEYLKESPTQRVVKQQLGVGEGKSTAGEGKAKPKTEKHRRQEALLNWGKAYSEWAHQTQRLLEKHVKQDPCSRLAWVALEASSPAFPPFDYPTWEGAALQSTGKPPEEKSVGAETAKLLDLVASCAAGAAKMDAWMTLADSVSIDDRHNIHLAGSGPELVARICKTFRFEKLTAPPVYETFLSKDLQAVREWKAGDYAVFKPSRMTVNLGSIHEGKREIFTAAGGSGWATPDELEPASEDAIEQYKKTRLKK